MSTQTVGPPIISKASFGRYKVEGSAPLPQYWMGGSLDHMGKNHKEEPLWRVVWSDSIRFMFRATDSDTYNWLPAYRGVHKFVLERWMTAYQFDKSTEESWNLRNRYQGDLGPFPADGVWFGPCEIFEDVPSLGAVEATIRLIVMGDNYSAEEKRLAIIQAQEKDEELQLNRKRDMILDSLPLSVTSGKLTNRFYNDAENIPDRLSAQDVAKIKHMPLGENKCFTSGTKRI